MKKMKNYTQNLLMETQAEKPFSKKNKSSASRDAIIKRAKAKLVCDGNRSPCIVTSQKQFMYPPIL